MAASANLTTLDDCRRYLHLPDASHDALIESLIASVSEAVEQYCGREFGRKIRTFQTDGKGEAALLLPVRPVVRVIELHDDPARTFAAASRIPSDRYVVYPDEGIVRLVGGGFFPGMRNVRVVYEAGYDALPATLSHAAMMIVAAAYTRAAQGADALQSESIGAYTVSYDNADWPAPARAMLSRYRECRIG